MTENKVKNDFGNDWRMATKKQKTAYLLVSGWELVIGGLGIFFTIQFALTARQQAEYSYAGLAFLCAVVTHVLSRVNIFHRN